MRDAGLDERLYLSAWVLQRGPETKLTCDGPRGLPQTNFVRKLIRDTTSLIDRLWLWHRGRNVHKIRQVTGPKTLKKSGLIAVSDKRHRPSLGPAISGLSRLVFRDAGCQYLQQGCKGYSTVIPPPRLVPTTVNRCFPRRKLGRLFVYSPAGVRNNSTGQPLGRVPPKPM